MSESIKSMETHNRKRGIIGMGVREKIANAEPTSWLKDWLTENMTEEEIQEIVIEAKEKAREQIKLIDTLDKIRAELIQSIQNGVIKIESGNEELFSIIDKYKNTGGEGGK